MLAQLHAATAQVAYMGIFRPGPFPMELTRERWQAFGGQLWVAEDDDRPIGFVAFDADEVHALYVLPERWRCGVGDRLLALAATAWRLWVLEANLRARRFYERRGWWQDGAVRTHPPPNEHVHDLLYRKGQR